MLLLLLLLCSGLLDVVHGVSASAPFHHAPQHDGKDSAVEFSNEWVVHLEGAKNAADLLALKLGYENLGEVYTVEKDQRCLLPARSLMHYNCKRYVKRLKVFVSRALDALRLQTLH